MFYSNLNRAVAVLALFAASALLTGCPADDESGPSTRAGSTAGTTVVFQMTGLLLVVPPGQGGGAMHVLLPKVPGDLDEHVAWIGFGISRDAPFTRSLCVGDQDGDPYGERAIQAGICYVNLDRWQLDSIGRGGEPATSRELPSGLLNVTFASGGQHRVHFPWVDDRIRSKVVFLTGEAGKDPCRLATWVYEPVDQNERPQFGRALRLVSVLNWEIRDPEARTLTFRLRTKPDSLIAVPLPRPDASGRIEVLLAHIPADERADLPPATPPDLSPPDPETTVAQHFDAYYNLLSMSRATPNPIPDNSRRRRIPHHPRSPRLKPCEVRITSQPGPRPAAEDSGALALVARQDTAAGTYACMPAFAEPGS